MKLALGAEIYVIHRPEFIKKRQPPSADKSHKCPALSPEDVNPFPSSACGCQASIVRSIKNEQNLPISP